MASGTKRAKAIAKWKDKLRGKEKYVWLSDTYELKQEREIEKFEKANQLAEKYENIKRHIFDNLQSSDEKRRKVAMVAYFIDTLSMRIGDEKDDDEADTMGAATLTKDNITIKDGNIVEFDFLGKDSVRWQIETKLPTS